MIVLAITAGRRGVSELLRRMFQWRVNASWYAVALLLPITISTAAAGLNILLGAAPPSSQQLGTWPALAGTFALLLLVPGIGGAWEEPGWRGYLTPQLQGRHTGLTASLITGVLWASWHVPLFVNGIVPWSDALTIIPTAIVFAWVSRHEQHRGLVANHVLWCRHNARRLHSSGTVVPCCSCGHGARRSRAPGPRQRCR